jgi:hypothetical protein
MLSIPFYENFILLFPLGPFHIGGENNDVNYLKVGFVQKLEWWAMINNFLEMFDYNCA